MINRVRFQKIAIYFASYLFAFWFLVNIMLVNLNFRLIYKPNPKLPKKPQTVYLHKCVTLSNP